MPQIQGAEILDALSKIKEPATFSEIVRYVASCYEEPSERIEQLVQAALTAGVRYGFVQKHRDLYYAIKDAQKALDEDADYSDDEEDEENDDIEDNENDDMDSAPSGESFCSFVDPMGTGSPGTNKPVKDSAGPPLSKGKEPARRESRHDARTLKKHDSKHGIEKGKKGATGRQNDEDERNSGDEEEDEENYSDDDGKHASTCPRDCAACAARKRAAAARRRRRKGRSRSRSRRRR